MSLAWVSYALMGSSLNNGSVPCTKLNSHQLSAYFSQHLLRRVDSPHFPAEEIEALSRTTG